MGSNEKDKEDSCCKNSSCEEWRGELNALNELSRFSELEQKIVEEKKKIEKNKGSLQKQISVYSLAYRMVTEFIVSVVLSFGIGWGIDSFLGTTPLFVLIFLVLGFCAGVKCIMDGADR
jgi:ATP synthase protein I